MRVFVLLPLLLLLPWVLDLATRVKHREHVRSGSVVVVTGASRGVGLALTLELASQGVLVIAGVRSATDLKSFPSSPQIHPMLLDVSSKVHLEEVVREVSSIVQTTKRSFVGVIANAAMVFRTPNEFETEEQEQKVFDVNYFGTVRLVRKFLPLLIAHQGRAVIVGSAGAMMPVPFVSTYVATKAALFAYANSLRAEIESQGVAVSYVSLGTVQTDMLSTVSGGGSFNSSVYDSLASKMEKVFRSIEPLTSTTTQVVSPIIDLLFVPYPPCTAYVGLDAKVSVASSVLLPQRVLQFTATNALIG